MIVKAKATAARLAAVIPELPIYRFSVDQYHQMIDLGFLTSPVELIDGWVVPKMPKKPPHVRSSQKVARRIESLLPAGWHLRRQDPITTLDSEPEPDIAVVQGAEEDYGECHPAPTDVGLIVEVSDASLATDLGAKMRIYARAGIPIYWVVNLVADQLEVYTRPTGPHKSPTYRKKQIHRRHDSVPLMLAGKRLGAIAVCDLLP